MKATALTIVPDADDEIPTPVAVYVEANPVSVLLDEGLRIRFLAEIEAEIDRHVPDLTTDKGRKEIGRLARRYASTKTAIDEAGKVLNAEARKQIDAVDVVRRELRAELDKMRDRAREPLTKWEEAEEARLAEVERIMALLRGATVIGHTDAAETIAARIIEVEAVPDEEVYALMKVAALEALRAGHARKLQDEADRAELERLRAEKEAREREDEARAAKERRAAEEAARKEREEQAAREREAAEAARAAAEAEAKAAREEAEQAQAEARRLAAEKAAADHAEAQRKAEEARLAAEEEARQKDRKHRSAVMKAAKEALMVNCSLDEEKARNIVTAINKGLIPNVTVNF